MKIDRELASAHLPKGIKVEFIGNALCVMTVTKGKLPAGLKSLMATIRGGKLSVDYLEVTKQRKGHGAKWLHWLEQYAAKLGCEQATGEAQHGTEGFWESQGYKLSSRGEGKRQRITKPLQLDLWQNNEIQFARLIDELSAAGAFSADIMGALCDSMDLTADEIDGLIERARQRFEQVKAVLASDASDSFLSKWTRVIKETV